MKKIFTSMLILSSLFLFACNSDEGRNAIINPVQELPTGRGSIEIVVRRSKVPSASFNVVGSSPSIPADSTGVVVKIDPSSSGEETIYLKENFNGSEYLVLNAKLLTGEYDITIITTKITTVDGITKNEFLTMGTAEDVQVKLDEATPVTLSLSAPSKTPITQKKVYNDKGSYDWTPTTIFYGGDELNINIPDYSQFEWDIPLNGTIDTEGDFAIKDIFSYYKELPKSDTKKTLSYQLTYKYKMDNIEYSYTDPTTYTLDILPNTGTINIVIE